MLVILNKSVYLIYIYLSYLTIQQQPPAFFSSLSSFVVFSWVPPPVWGFWTCLLSCNQLNNVFTWVWPYFCSWGGCPLPYMSYERFLKNSWILVPSFADTSQNLAPSSFALACPCSDVNCLWIRSIIWTSLLRDRFCCPRYTPKLHHHAPL